MEDETASLKGESSELKKQGRIFSAKMRLLTSNMATDRVRPLILSFAGYFGFNINEDTPTRRTVDTMALELGVLVT